MSIEELQEELIENKEVLQECITENDKRGIATQKRVIRLLEVQIEEKQLPSRLDLEMRGERYGYDFY